MGIPPKDADMLRPRRRRVSALLADKALASAERPQPHDVAKNQNRKPEAGKELRRRTIYIPSDDTTVMTIHPGSSHDRCQPKSPDRGFDLVTLSDEEPAQPAPVVKRTHVSRKSLAAAPKRRPLKQSSRQLQAMSFIQDVVGETLGKENIPPGMSLKNHKHLCTSALFLQSSQSRVKPAAKSEPRRQATTGLGAATGSSASRSTSNRKRTNSDSVASPSKAIRTTRAKSQPKPPLHNTIAGCEAKCSARAYSSPPDSSRSPPLVLRRNRTEKHDSDLHVPKVSQRPLNHEKYPVVSEDLDMPELYQDSWLNYQEVAITQLVNKLFDSANAASRDKQEEEGVHRKKLLEVYQNSSVSLLHKRLQASLTYGALSIPKDLLAKSLRLQDDIGLRRKYLNLFVHTYEFSVLKAAAEAVVGRQCPTPATLYSGTAPSGAGQRQKRAEKKAIEGFLDTFLIRNEDAVRVKTGVGSRASIVRGHDKGDEFGSQSWSWRRTTLRTLMLILLLDMSKSKDIVNIPLFQVTSAHKSSRAVLQEFSSMLLPSLGDISRPLGHLDYHLYHVQHPLQEYHYRIENLATDLRDGVLLTRLVELLLYRPTFWEFQKDVAATMPTGEVLTSSFRVEDKDPWVLSQHLKFPCGGRPQKIFNVQVALSALEGVRGDSVQITRDFTAEDIVDGHREKTLGLLWCLVGNWGLDTLINWSELQNETIRYRGRYCSQQPDDYQDSDSEDESEISELSGLGKQSVLLRDWARSIARLRGLCVANLTTSFADGRVLEAIVDEYTAHLPNPRAPNDSPNDPDSSVCGLSVKLKSIGCSPAFISMLASAQGTSARPIPSKDFTITTLAFLASRLLPASRLHRAATTIQRQYRLHLSRHEVSKRIALMRLAAHCATVVQTREQVIGAAVVLQRAWRHVLDARVGKLVNDITAFQALVRGWAVRKTALLSCGKNKASVRRAQRIRGGW
ncbi:IQ motif EF-hand binding site [Macrophomina phaseolina MS6]|uniref:IQ motif EF-hand binding site n=2 Tax=Macrophomina phaseolina TaxID=35725 RepID=K2RKJ7_MACPH|nr:IQ motif EF-hand binding site [Macrophomina phaseolina MS6]